MDETGQPGDAAPTDSGGGAAGPRGDGPRLNGWPAAEAAWSSAGAALDPEATSAPTKDTSTTPTPPAGASNPTPNPPPQ